MQIKPVFLSLLTDQLAARDYIAEHECPEATHD